MNRAVFNGHLARANAAKNVTPTACTLKLWAMTACRFSVKQKFQLLKDV